MATLHKRAAKRTTQNVQRDREQGESRYRWTSTEEGAEGACETAEGTIYLVSGSG